MKAHLLSLAASLFLPAALCAQIPNAGFEQWSPSGMGYNDPDGWLTWNVISWPVGAVLSCEQASPGAAGTYYAKVTTLDLPGVGILPGLIFTGGQTAAGFPYTARPDALNGKYQYNIPGGDGGMIAASFTKWTGGQQISVGGGMLSIPPGSQSSWASFSVEIAWFTTDFPDTATVTVMSSTADGVAGSTISVDDLSFGAFTSVNEVPAGTPMQVSMLPGTGVLWITTGHQMAELEVLDTSGRLHARQTLRGLVAETDVSGLANGTYIARIRFADGTYASRMFVKY
ncbi:MAG: T9SS type A sorting domain-containing protein [Flavobacteriales bacterium]|nr:T9SS type A sorting domain-containing protein [Flavobacteriales bacterium]